MKHHCIYVILCLLLFTSCCKVSEKQTETGNKAAPSSGYVLIDGTKLDYVVEGEGTSCLVIGSSVYYPKTFSLELRRYLKMYFVDMRWFAKEYNPVVLKEYTIETITSDIERVRKALHLDKVILIGHSIHGTIAMEYAKRYPEHLSHVIAIGSPNIMGNETYEQAVTDLWNTASEERRTHQQSLTQALSEASKDSISEQPLVKQYIADAGRYWYDYDYDATWLWDGMTVHEELTGHLFGTIFADYNMFANNKTLEVPAYVAMGIYDYIIPYTLWIPEKNRPNLTIELFDQSGHTPQLEEPQEFGERLIAWINRNK